MASTGNKSATCIQDGFLNEVRKKSIKVTIYLSTGNSVKGLVKAFDPFTVLLMNADNTPILVYKHAMVSVVPDSYVSVFD
ncbi:MAG: RNA chaperone Hfq [Abditibacteriota bacterium]|nr:RNA chaperone Hfq [Abditibacteriota bacterium]MBP5093297.1 RNA chaperone Hfq [Abditibacteriota bacterium]MBP5718866.1 RNA chaperone Hfq [Abditibacteriota bacterium]MBP5738009.1 RNA chaperone Hfq [Abditibacteriota bacterium]MBQ7525057.1 RNA chaperone Hfq [Abditibacteriota bacterium]